MDCSSALRVKRSHAGSDGGVCSHPARRVPVGADADSAYTGFVKWATDRGISLYPAQDESVTESGLCGQLFQSSPTGTGKSLVAVAAHASCLARGGRTYYTAPIQRLRSTTG